ncbi:type I restriction-modification system subunit M [Psychrobacter piscatorii]|uniref:site-specific DNA-methyltransferase (adenine-specific) n=1 Tax=Psychrobacter piscatorii TaxID=554343 RepID=A0A0T6DTF6_9GAMM|nr:class I SAM-dependent DNA methyltransferase [Psychrobacter piscatorii]KRU22903.1 restriction endonuclease subunit M [Psychrobacter piscatorii]
MTKNFSQTAAFIWSVADLLRGDFKQSQYGRIILPFTLLRRLECVLEETKAAVVAESQRIANLPIEKQPKTEEAQANYLKRASKRPFYNTSPMDLSKMGQSDIKDNLNTYVQSFSKDAREIFEHFKFEEFVGQLADANLLYKVVQMFATTDLSPETISNHEMGFVFEELIRRFAESSNETAGEHFTPRDIVRLTTSLVFMEDDDALTKDGIIRTIYDPTAGTGGFLSSGMEYVLELNPDAVMRTYGQELNPESYAICKADMLIKGQEVNNIKLGNTLSSDQLVAEKFDYMLSNPPFGVDWKKISGEIKDEHEQKGFDGRFGAGLPRVSDGSLLFLMHLISKMRPITTNEQEAGNSQNGNQGSRIGIILNGSPLFTGGAGSGESEIRRYILEADLLEAIIALPNDMFYNTGIATYIWILSNKKADERRGKVQLIDGSNLYSKMRKSLGSKRNEMSEDDAKTIIRSFGDFEVVDARVLDKPEEVKSNRGRQSANPTNAPAKTFASKIFATHEFGYRRITIERPLRLSAQLSDAAIETLRYASKPFDMVMPALYEAFGSHWTTDSDSNDSSKSYGDLSAVALEARAMIKADFSELKEKQIKDVLDAKVWQDQLAIMNKAKALQAAIGENQFDDFNEFEKVLKQALKDADASLDISLDAKEKKQLLDAITWKNPEAEPVIKKAVKVANPLYGAFSYKSTNSNKPAKIVEFQTDSDLRDYENVPLNPEVTTTELIESYFTREVQPHVPDAWINADKTDAIDEEVGIVGFEIPFNRHFYVYEPPRPLAEIDADLDAVSTEIMQLLGEVHS